MDSPLMEELDAITEGKSKLDLAEEIWRLRRAQPEAARTVEWVSRGNDWWNTGEYVFLRGGRWQKIGVCAHNDEGEQFTYDVPPLPQEEGP